MKPRGGWSRLAGLALTAGLSIGALPVSAQSFEEVDATVRDGIKRGIYPGAVVVIGRRDSLLYARGYGHFTWSRRTGSEPVHPLDSLDNKWWHRERIMRLWMRTTRSDARCAGTASFPEGSGTR